MAHSSYDVNTMAGDGTSNKRHCIYIEYFDRSNTSVKHKYGLWALNAYLIRHFNDAIGWPLTQMQHNGRISISWKRAIPFYSIWILSKRTYVKWPPPIWTVKAVPRLVPVWQDIFYWNANKHMRSSLEIKHFSIICGCFSPDYMHFDRFNSTILS